MPNCETLYFVNYTNEENLSTHKRKQPHFTLMVQNDEYKKE